jgi:hypothetical protein
MGVMPNGSAGATPDIDYSLFAGGFGGLKDRTQANIQQVESDRLKGNSTLTGFSDQLFEGFDAALGIILAPLKALLETLFPWLDFVGTTTWNAVKGVVDGILEGIKNLAVMASTAINQIGDVLNGLIVTPINTAVTDFRDWVAEQLGFRTTTVSTTSSLQNVTHTISVNSVRKPQWWCRYPDFGYVVPRIRFVWSAYRGCDGGRVDGYCPHPLDRPEPCCVVGGV